MLINEFRTYQQWCKDNGKDWRIDDDFSSAPHGNFLYEASAIAWAHKKLMESGLNF